MIRVAELIDNFNIKYVQLARYLHGNEFCLTCNVSKPPPIYLSYFLLNQIP